MERRDSVNRYKEICFRFLQKSGLQVHVDVEISDTVKWRPHLFAKDGSKIIVDILDLGTVPSFLLDKYIQAMNSVPGLEVSLALIGDLDYFPDLFSICYQHGLGIIVIQNDLPKQILPPRPRQVQTLTEHDQIGIMPGKPYGNVLGLKKCFRLCREYLNWIEVNLPRKSFEILYDSIQDEDLKVQTIRLMRGVDDKLTTRFRTEFEQFREELSADGVKAELRVIIERSIATTIHGRYMYSKDNSGKDIKIHLPPVNSLKGNQWDTIFTDLQLGPPFDAHWASAVDITLDWNKVAKAVTQHIKNKEAEKRTRNS